MNKYQKEVEKQLLEDEKQILEELKQNYAKALKDVKERIKNLTSDKMTQSKIYQKQYQENLEKQLQAIIDLLSSDNVQSINDYLVKTYQDGFIGTLYNMQNEGVPFIMAIDQETVLKSITKKTDDFQLSKNLYQNAEELKKTLKSEITRGISQGYMYNQIARNIKNNSEADLKKAYRIARTEGGRVQNEAKFECMTRAKANGADVVKQWDSVIDKRTRKSHAELDGQIRELEEPFEINGHKTMYPQGFGIASEDINCRCIVLERARWAVEDEKNFTKNIDGDIVEFKNVKDYQDYKKKYFEFYENNDKMSKTNKEVKELKYLDITDKYVTKKRYQIKKQKQFIDNNGTKYRVDGKHVIFSPTPREIEVAKLLGKAIGGTVNIIPRINKPLGVKTPDYIINGEKFDLKEITGGGKYTIQGNIKGKEKQSNNFAIDITKAKFNIDESERQIQKIYESKHYLWLNKIILIQENKIIKVYKRKK